VRADRGEERRLDREVDPRGERDRAQHAHGILAKPHVGVADRSHDLVAQVVEAADVIDDREGGDVVEERVDREVAAEGVFLGRAERVVAMDQVLAFGRRRVGRRHAVGDDLFSRANLASERRHLDHLRSELDVREAEAAADDPAVAEELLDLMRVRRRADVEILRAAAEQEIADAAADEVRDVLALAEPVQHLECVSVDVAARYRMLIAWNDPRVAHRAAIVR